MNLVTGVNSPEITVSDPNIFDAVAPTFTFVNSQTLDFFRNISTVALADAIETQLGTWLENIRGSSFFQTKLPFSGGKTLADVLPLREQWIQKLVEPIRNPPAGKVFETLNDFKKLLAPTITDIRYNVTTQDLTFQVNLLADLLSRRGGSVV